MGDAPVIPDKISSKFDTPGRFAGSYVIADSESVTAVRSLSRAAAGVSVSNIRVFGSGFDFDIFEEGSRRLRTRACGAVNRCHKKLFSCIQFAQLFRELTELVDRYCEEILLELFVEICRQVSCQFYMLFLIFSDGYYCGALVENVNSPATAFTLADLAHSYRSTSAACSTGYANRPRCSMDSSTSLSEFALRLVAKRDCHEIT